MLKQLRQKKTMKRILWTLAVLIIPPFVFWGAGSALHSKQKGPDYAGTIFGKKISFEEYTAAWQATKNRAIMTYGQKLDEIYESLDLDKQAWDRLILLREAKKRRIRVSDDEVINTIQSFPFLQSKGMFDQRAYDLVLKQVFRIEARQFEEELRDTIAISKLADSIIKGIKVTDQEVADAYKNENEKSKISYILISPATFKKNILIPEAELKKYYQDNAESFRVPDQVNIDYLGFEFPDYQNDIQVKDEEVKSYYEKHKDGFDPKKKFEDLKDAIKNQLIQEKAKEKALTAAEKIDYTLSDKTKSLEGVAKENGLLVKETGFFAKEGLIPQIGWFPEIQKTAFKLNIGEKSELIKSKAGFAKGYYIISLKEKKPAYIPVYDEVKQQIENILKSERAKKAAYKEAQRLHKKIAELIKTKNMKFNDAAASLKHNPKYTEPFARTGYVQGVGSGSEFGDAAFGTKPGDFSPVTKTQAGFCIFTVVEITPIDQEKFKKEKEDFTKKTVEGKKSKMLDDWYTKLIETANLKSNVSPERTNEYR